MKKCKFYILFMICVILYPFGHDVNASEFSFSVHAEPAVVDASGEQTKLKFMVSTGSEEDVITSCQFKVSAGSGVRFIEDESPNGWNVDKGTNGYLVDSGDGVSEGVIMNAIYEVYSNTTITVTDVECGNVDKDIVYTVDEAISVDVKIADTVNIKVDGVTVTGKITNPLAAMKQSFVLAVTSADISVQGNVRVEIADTATGTKQLCTGDTCKEVTVNFSSENFCGSAECVAFKPSVGDNIQLNVYIGSTLNKSFYVIRELTNTEVLDASLKKLKVWGIDIELEEGKTFYTIKVPASTTDYSVVAELSDPNNFVWDDEDNPSKYNFKTDTINLIIRPKNTEAIGAKEVVYVVAIEQDGSSSSSKPINPSSSSSNPISNPQTSGISQFIVAIVLFGSLSLALTFYKKNMEEYK